MNPMNGRVFALGHLIIPIVLATLFASVNSQPIVLALALLSLLWSFYLIWHAFYSTNFYSILQKPTYWIYIIADTLLISAIFSFPTWETGPQPTWLILFLVSFYAFELRIRVSIYFCFLGVGNLFLYAYFQHKPFFVLDPLLNVTGMVLFICFVGLNADRLLHIAYHDLLTKLPNRYLFKQKLTDALEDAKKKQTKLSILFLDLDQFKYVNDTMGHTIGDQLLQTVAARIIKIAPKGTLLSRMGGDEFTMMITQLPNSDEAARIAENAIETFKESFRLSQHELFITTSIGIAVYPEDGKDTDTLMKNADTAMYRAKEHGRNTYQFYNPAEQEVGIERIKMETMLRHAIERDEFVVYYQPRMCTVTEQLVCVESLVRWRHPELGMIQPLDFIPLAEDTGLIVTIGEIVLRKACVQRQLWTKKGIPPFRVSVNLSPRQFRQLDLPETIQRVLQDTKMEPQYLELEITESAAMQDVNFAIPILAVLKEMDLTIAIDDFGTGYSSLSYLKKFPIDVIKIDQSFIQGIYHNSDDAAIVRAIIVLAHTLKLNVTAEGVETSEQYEFLVEQGCNEIQGYLYGKPMEAQTLEDWIELERITKSKALKGF